MNLQVEGTTLVLLTKRYPFYPGEEFLELELQYLSAFFQRIIVIPTEFKGSPQTLKRPLPDNAEVKHIPAIPSAHPIFQRIKEIIRIASDPQALSWIGHDLRKSLKREPVDFRRLITFVHLAIQLKKMLLQSIKNEPGDFLFYSYWLNGGAIALAMMKQKKASLRAVSRTHGYDLYKERHAIPYIPLQLKTIRNMNRLFVISNHGYDYLLKQDKSLKEVLQLSRLGVEKSNQVSKPSSDGIFRIVSCSYMVPVKRLELLIEALRHCTIPIHWTHIGDGELRNVIEMQVQKLPKHITTDFVGNVSNDQVIQFYERNPIDLFVNVSSSEGVPVSIMEAFSCGIPVMATDVGGVSELVNARNGYLIPKHITPKDIAARVERFSRFQSVEINLLRLHAYNTWNKLSNAETNYETFVESLLNIRKEKGGL
ncbi:MAG: hypothetical protein JWM44_1920 [Bacilli bacterium]|nr:hypothetical protein [Bacilli bacterium]